ncbi:ribosomal protein rpl13 [Salpingoeca rosetta]|uniref:Ribosomal protein rpl13 n=1 Tax=Salpingoeca rosetta (strain ATCC 50818 / BSB-021) TaxID=946362 RepID=F2U8M2_SALR5|nr:ribosomal protein rpl13 [Salpingoeca rosetta]EGD72730.1 ribosomal protein rpl13 [Salpingoeca rosetta]|eukprot:XP_004994553.1 ribosomal protein rpl13 [Salpingoeca rosetta]
MTKAHNNMLPNVHLHKHWHNSVWTYRGVVKCHFNQAGKKRRRSLKRQSKAKQVAPRPTGGALRPIARCQTFKYNMRLRAGRGFTPLELKEAGLSTRYAQTVGISVDKRRKNRSVEAFQANVARLKEYKSKLVVIRKGGKDQHAVEQLKGVVMPIVQPKHKIQVRAITEKERKRNVFAEMRHMRADAKLAGIRLKVAAEAAAEAAMKKKK